VNPKVSIVVPVYNAAAYLDQCLTSIVGQTYGDLEILLVNDGSADDSVAICDRYAAEDARIRVFHQENAGVSAARNRALDAATGRFVMFVDADDYVAPDFVRHMTGPMQDHDIVICGYERFRETGAQPFLIGGSRELELRELYEHTLCTNEIGGGCCNKIFARDVIDDLGLRFDPRIAVGEDFLFLSHYYRRCRTAHYVGEVLYHYRYSADSATRIKHGGESAFPASKASILTALDEMEAAIDPAVAFQRAFLDYRKARSSLRLFFQMALSGHRDRELLRQIQRNIRSGVRAYLRSPHALVLEKLAAAGISVSANLTFVGTRAASLILGRRLDRYLD
jgi:glycosyltransferase involved in cell wall biosynthesis